VSRSDDGPGGGVVAAIGGLTILQSGRGDETAEAPLLDEDVRRVEGWVLEQA